MSQAEKKVLTVGDREAGTAYLHPGWYAPSPCIDRTVIKRYPSGTTRYAWLDKDGRALRVDWLKAIPRDWAAILRRTAEGA